jgi:hypothetical protein
MSSSANYRLFALLVVMGVFFGATWGYSAESPEEARIDVEEFVGEIRTDIYSDSPDEPTLEGGIEQSLGVELPDVEPANRVRTPVDEPIRSLYISLALGAITIMMYVAAVVSPFAYAASGVVPWEVMSTIVLSLFAAALVYLVKRGLEDGQGV